MTVCVERAEVERVVDCPFSVAEDYVVDLLRRWGRDGRRVAYALRLDETELGRPHDEVVMRWDGGVALIRTRICGTRTLLRVAAGEPPIPDARLRDLLDVLAAELERREAGWRGRATVPTVKEIVEPPRSGSAPAR